MITFIRHCECYPIDKYGVPNYMRVNPPLTRQGKMRASKLCGTYDYVIISPLNRCLETFIYSQINGKRIVSDFFRELIMCPGDFMQNDPPEITADTMESFKKRIDQGMNFLKTLSGNICVITHSEWMKEALGLSYIPDYGASIEYTLN